MKKFIVAIFATLYLGTSTGVTVHLHYCMGKLVDWAVWQNNSSKCSSCGMEKTHQTNDNGCCKDEYKQIKNNKDQKLSERFAQLSKTITDVPPISLPIYSISLPLVLSKEFPKTNTPPRSCTTSINIINCVFRI